MHSLSYLCFVLVLIVNLINFTEQAPQSRQQGSLDDRYFDDDNKRHNFGINIIIPGGPGRQPSNWETTRRPNGSNPNWTYDPNVIPGQTTSSAPRPTVDSVTQCIRNCPTTPEYNPVCGSNGVTYSNPGRAQCAMNCGVDIVQWRSGTCDQSTGK